MTDDRTSGRRPALADRPSVALITLVFTLVGGVVAVVTVLFGDAIACNGGYTGWPCKSEGPVVPTAPPPPPATVEPSVAAPPPPSPPTTEGERGPVVLLSDEVTLRPPACNTTNGIDVDSVRVVDSPPASEFVYIDDACVRGGASMSALEGVPMALLSRSPGRMPTLDECQDGLRSPDNDMSGMSADGGVMCFATTDGNVAGVVLRTDPDQTVYLDVTVWGG